MRYWIRDRAGVRVRVGVGVTVRVRAKVRARVRVRVRARITVRVSVRARVRVRVRASSKGGELPVRRHRAGLHALVRVELLLRARAPRRAEGAHPLALGDIDT